MVGADFAGQVSLPDIVLTGRDACPIGWTTGHIRAVVNCRLPLGDGSCRRILFLMPFCEPSAHESLLICIFQVNPPKTCVSSQDKHGQTYCVSNTHIQSVPPKNPHK